MTTIPTARTEAEDRLAWVNNIADSLRYIVKRARQDAHLRVAADILDRATEAERNMRRLREAEIAEYGKSSREA